jgi:hypothetical protein
MLLTLDDTGSQVRRGDVVIFRCSLNVHKMDPRSIAIEFLLSLRYLPGVVYGTIP